MNDDSDSTETNIGSLEEGLPQRQHPLPWILFGISCVTLALVGGLLWKRLGSEIARTNYEKEQSANAVARSKVAVQAREDAEKKLGDAEAKAKLAEDKVAELNSQVKRLEDEKAKMQKELEAAGKKTVSTADAKDNAAAGKKKPKKKKKKGVRSAARAVDE